MYDLETGAGMEVGRVTAWDPGQRLALTWSQVGWPAGVHTDIDVSFEALDGRTRVCLEHSGFERVRDGEQFHGGYDAGWKEVLGWFAESINSPPREEHNMSEREMSQVGFYWNCKGTQGNLFGRYRDAESS